MNEASRREFLRITISGIGVLLLPFPLRAFAAGAAASGNFPREIGATFMRASSAPAKAQQLKQQVEQIKSPQEMQAFLTSAIEEDYRTGKCFSYETWQLSLTEGALCALYGS